MSINVTHSLLRITELIYAFKITLLCNLHFLRNFRLPMKHAQIFVLLFTPHNYALTSQKYKSVKFNFKVLSIKEK